MPYVAQIIMDTAAALLNDAGKSLYSYAVQLPYLRIAHQEMEQECDLNENPLNLISEYTTNVPALQLHPSLPTDFFLPISLQERPNGSTKDSEFVEMTEVPNVFDLKADPTTTLIYWDWRHNCINFVGSTVIRNVRIYYWRQLSTPNDETTVILQRQTELYLQFRTAALCSEFIGGVSGTPRAVSLNIQAQMSLDRLMSLLVKNNQNKRVRRKPFRGRRPYQNYRVIIP